MYPFKNENQCVVFSGVDTYTELGASNPLGITAILSRAINLTVPPPSPSTHFTLPQQPYDDGLAVEETDI